MKNNLWKQGATLPIVWGEERWAPAIRSAPIFKEVGTGTADCRRRRRWGVGLRISSLARHCPGWSAVVSIVDLRRKKNETLVYE